MSSAQGFVSTLESVIASALFLIVIISILPAFVSTPDPGRTVQSVLSRTLETMQRTGQMQGFVADRNTSGLAATVADHIEGWNVGSSMLATNMTEGRAEAGDTTVQISINESLMERARLLLWVGRNTEAEVDLDGTSVVNVSTPGVAAVDLTDDVDDSSSSVTLSVTGSAVPYRFETYNRYESRAIPSADVISHTRMVEDANASYDPAEVIVYAWQ